MPKILPQAIILVLRVLSARESHSSEFEHFTLTTQAVELHIIQKTYIVINQECFHPSATNQQNQTPGHVHLLQLCHHVHQRVSSASLVVVIHLDKIHCEAIEDHVLSVLFLPGRLDRLDQR